jgi:hypothetical protein
MSCSSSTPHLVATYGDAITLAAIDTGSTLRAFAP